MAALLRTERNTRSTRKGTQALSCWIQAVSGIAWFRDRPNLHRHGKAFGISQATASRYPHEVIEIIEVPADQTPDLHQALEHAAADGQPHLILDGKIIDTDRCRSKAISVKSEQIDSWYPGRPTTSAATSRRCSSLPILADPGYQGAGQGVLVPFNSPPTEASCTSTTAPTTPCCAPCGASANAASPCSPNAGPPSSTSPSAPGRIGDLVRAALVLVHFEHRRIN